MEHLDKVSDYLANEKEKLDQTRRAISALDNTKPPQLSVAEALSQRFELVDNMHKTLASIGHVLMCHETTIHKRWSKWKQEQRRAILLKSWGDNMAPHHRPDWHAIFGNTRDPDVESGIALLCPSVNQEDLLKPRSLLLFLHSRGKHHPAKFADADLEAMHLGVTMKRIGAGHLPGYVMMFTNHKQIAHYGELVHVGTNPKSDTQPHVNGNCLSMAFNRFGQSFGRLGAPTNGRFSYPVEKRMTQENVAALRRAESHLDAFWEAFDKPVVETFRPLEKTAIRRFLLQPRVLQRTPAWIEPPRIKPSVPQLPTASFAQLELDRRHLTEQTISEDERKPLLKAKNKTRGVTSQAELQQEETDTQKDPGHTDHNHTPSFSVDSRALKVFKTIFYTPSITATPGEVKWLDFLHAMASVGFAPEKLYGSVWHFRPSGPGLDRSINFHEPHKEGKGADKTPYAIARGIGRRLNRAYGWDGSSFALAEK